MKSLSALLASVAFASPPELSEFDISEQFDHWKETHKKEYASTHELWTHREHFKTNLIKIMELNDMVTPQAAPGSDRHLSGRPAGGLHFRLNEFDTKFRTSDFEFRKIYSQNFKKAVILTIAEQILTKCFAKRYSDMPHEEFVRVMGGCYIGTHFATNYPHLG